MLQNPLFNQPDRQKICLSLIIPTKKMWVMTRSVTGLSTYDRCTRLFLSTRFAGMDAQSRLQTGAPNGGRFGRGDRMRERLCLGERLD